MAVRIMSPLPSAKGDAAVSSANLYAQLQAAFASAATSSPSAAAMLLVQGSLSGMPICLPPSLPSLLDCISFLMFLFVCLVHTAHFDISYGAQPSKFREQLPTDEGDDIIFLGLTLLQVCLVGAAIALVIMIGILLANVPETL